MTLPTNRRARFSSQTKHFQICDRKEEEEEVGGKNMARYFCQRVRMKEEKSTSTKTKLVCGH